MHSYISSVQFFSSKLPAFITCVICLLIAVTGVLISGCKKLDLKREIAVTTDTITVSNTIVTANGTVIDLGKGNIPNHGHCWSTSTNPTIDDDTTSLGAVSQTAVFSSDITNLITDTTYYIRAYATDGSFVKYGIEKSFMITAVEFLCGTVLIDERDGKSYNTVLIGTQCWMAENLKTGSIISSGGSSDNQINNSVIEKFCYDNGPASCNDDGGLYQWNEAMQYSTTEGAQGICPSGWHIPTDDEWKTLEMYLSMSQLSADSSGWRGTDQGTQLIVGGSAGFNVGPAGFRKADGSFEGNPGYAYYWTSTSKGVEGLSRGLSDSLETVYRNTVNKSYGFCVRCVKD